MYTMDTQQRSEMSLTAIWISLLLDSRDF